MCKLLTKYILFAMQHPWGAFGFTLVEVVAILVMEFQIQGYKIRRHELRRCVRTRTHANCGRKCACTCQQTFKTCVRCAKNGRKSPMTKLVGLYPKNECFQRKFQLFLKWNANTINEKFQSISKKAKNPLKHSTFLQSFIWFCISELETP